MRGARRGARPVVVVDRACVPVDHLGSLLDDLHSSVDAGAIDWVDLDELLDEPAVGAGAPTVVACGGDPVLRECISVVAGTSTALGLVPVGEEVAVAAELGAPGDGGGRPGALLAAALDGPLRRLDVGDVNGELFVTAAGFGAGAIAPAPLRARGLGRAASAVRMLRRHLAPVTVHVDGVQRWSGRAPVVVVGTGRNVLCSGAAVELFPDANPADGEIEVAVLGGGPLQARLLTWWRLLMRRLQPPEAFQRFRGEWVHVRSSAARSVDIDGYRRTPVPVLDVRVWPGALLVHEHVAEVAADPTH